VASPGRFIPVSAFESAWPGRLPYKGILLSPGLFDPRCRRSTELLQGALSPCSVRPDRRNGELSTSLGRSGFFNRLSGGSTEPLERSLTADNHGSRSR
jgi:hypothetical protein